MIGCDNDLCPIEWFHFNCVQLSCKPKGKWYCPKCRGDKQTVMKPRAQFLKELAIFNKEKEEKRFDVNILLEDEDKIEPDSESQGTSDSEAENETKKEEKKSKKKSKAKSDQKRKEESRSKKQENIFLICKMRDPSLVIGSMKTSWCDVIQFRQDKLVIIGFFIFIFIYYH